MSKMEANKNSILDRVAGEGYSLVWFSNINYFNEDVSTNCLTFLRPGIDIACVPKDEKTFSVIKWALSVFNYTEDQFFFYDTFNDEISQKIVIEKIINHFSNRKIKFLPFHTNLILNEVANKHNIPVINDNQWILPDKRWFHHNLPNSKYKEDDFGVELPSEINIPFGYVIYTLDELTEAKRLLNEKNVTKFIIKNVYGLGGAYLWPIRNETEYEIARNEMDFKTTLGNDRPPSYIVEELIDYDLCGKDEGMSPIVHYVGDVLCPGVYHQNFYELSYVGMNSIISKYEHECLRQAEIIKNTLHLKGPWGIDFVVDREGKVFIIDINYGRVCGSHHFRFFLSLYADGKSFDSWVFGDIEDVNKMYDILIENDLNFDFEKKRGVMLMRVLDPQKSTVLVVGDSLEDVNTLKKSFKKIFQNGINERYTLDIV